MGKTKDGKFIKYIGHEGLRAYHSESEFFGPMGNMCSIQVEGDTLILNGGIESFQGIQKQWRFRLKWDEKAQWLGIDYQDL